MKVYLKIWPFIHILNVRNLILSVVTLCVLAIILIHFETAMPNWKMRENVEEQCGQHQHCIHFTTRSNKGEHVKQETISSTTSKRDDFTSPDKWTILLTINNAFYDIFENWWWHFRILGLRVNVTVIAEDDFIFDKLKKHYGNYSIAIIRSWILNISEPLKFGTLDYGKMVTTRPVYILKYLNESTNVLYSDIDTLLLQNPFNHFLGNFDMWTQTEKNESRVCSGFMAIQSNARTVNLMERWISAMKGNKTRNQPFLNNVIKRSHVHISYLNESKFVAGPQFTKMSTEQRSEVVMLHASWCLNHKEKLKCFKKWNLWKM